MLLFKALLQLAVVGVSALPTQDGASLSIRDGTSMSTLHIMSLTKRDYATIKNVLDAIISNLSKLTEKVNKFDGETSMLCNSRKTAP
jgi:hypothetical protein